MQKSRSNKNLIISLIRDNLISTKLINGLNALGMETIHFTLNLSETIFELMEFDKSDKSDKIFEYYLELLDKVNHINISTQQDRLNELAKNIYRRLYLKKLGRDSKK